MHRYKTFDKNFKHRWPCPHADGTDGHSKENGPVPNGVVDNIHIHHSPATEEKKKRALPLHNTEDVFNEWGALLRQQDEIDQKLQKENYDKMRIRQQSYKAELDRQYVELQNKKKGVLGEQVKKEEEIIKYQEKVIEQKVKQEEDKKQKIKDEQKTDAVSGFTEVQIKRQQEEKLRELDREQNREKAKREEKLQNDMRLQSQIKKKQEENDYMTVLNLQAKEKQRKLQQEKETDKTFVVAETIKLNREESARNNFFNKLKKFQSDNEQKQKSLQRYMSQDQAALGGK